MVLINDDATKWDISGGIVTKVYLWSSQELINARLHSSGNFPGWTYFTCCISICLFLIENKPSLLEYLEMITLTSIMKHPSISFFWMEIWERKLILLLRECSPLSFLQRKCALKNLWLHCISDQPIFITSYICYSRNSIALHVKFTVADVSGTTLYY